MTQEHPITPPLDLVQEWSTTIYLQTEDDDQRDLYIATQAARWGADQELEACVLWLQTNFDGVRGWCEDLRAARRPKPPSLKERALKELAWVDENLNMPLLNQCDAIHTIRRALESLPD